MEYDITPKELIGAFDVLGISSNEIFLETELDYSELSLIEKYFEAKKDDIESSSKLHTEKKLTSALEDIEFVFSSSKASKASPHSDINVRSDDTIALVEMGENKKTETSPQVGSNKEELGDVSTVKVFVAKDEREETLPQATSSKEELRDVSNVKVFVAKDERMETTPQVDNSKEDLRDKTVAIAKDSAIVSEPKFDNANKDMQPSPPSAKFKQVNKTIVMEIGDRDVKIAQINSGKITSVGRSTIDNDTVVGASKEYINNLTQAIKIASSQAKISKGIGYNCIVVYGGSDCLVRHFTWPEIPQSSMNMSAISEMSSLFSNTATQYIVRQEIIRNNKPKEESSAPTVEVIVAALPKDVVSAIYTAVRRAKIGYKIDRLDIKENVRFKLINKSCLINSQTPQSYGILDVNDKIASLMLYFDGIFYSSRYFDLTRKPKEINHALNNEDIADVSNEEMLYSHDSVIGEITSILEYVHYREKKFSLECLLVMGESYDNGLADSLAESLYIPVHHMDTWLKDDVTTMNKEDIAPYLDAYGASVLSETVASKFMMNFNAEVIKEAPGSKRIVKGIIGISVLIFALMLGIIIPNANLSRLREEGSRYASQTEYYRDQAVDAAEVAARLVMVTSQMDSILNFYSEFPQARIIIPAIMNAGFYNIFSINVSGYTAIISVEAMDFVDAGMLLNYLRENDFFSDARTRSLVESNTEEVGTGTTNFSINLTIQEGIGSRE